MPESQWTAVSLMSEIKKFVKLDLETCLVDSLGEWLESRMTWELSRFTRDLAAIIWKWNR